MRALDVPLVITAMFAAQVAIAWLIGGWWGIAWLWVVHVVLNNFTWIVNSACHWPGLGARPHKTRDQSRNVSWLALATHGESHHNAHHRHPRSAHHGIDGGVDASFAVIRLLERLGLATEVQMPITRVPARDSDPPVSVETAAVVVPAVMTQSAPTVHQVEAE